MKILGLVFGLAIFASKAHAQTRSGELAGYISVNEKIKQRLFAEEQSVELSRYVADPSLARHLGYWERSGGASRYKNGIPNALNSSLWLLVIDRFASDLGRTCGDPKFKPMGASLRENARDLILRVCAWPAIENRGETLEQLWHLLMEFDAPYDEFLAWKELSSSPFIGGLVGAEAVRQIVRSIAVSPDFLLAH